MQPSRTASSSRRVRARPCRAHSHASERADAADLSRSLAIIDAQQLVLSVAFLAALWFFAAPTGPFMVIEEETVYIDEEEEEEEWFRW